MRVKLRYYLLITFCVPPIMLLNSVFKVFLCAGYSCHPYLIDRAAKTLGSGLTWAIQLQTVNLDLKLEGRESQSRGKSWLSRLEFTSLGSKAAANSMCFSQSDRDLKIQVHVRIREGVLRALEVTAPTHCTLDFSWGQTARRLRHYMKFCFILCV